jgi:hypothetical protein
MDLFLFALLACGKSDPEEVVPDADGDGFASVDAGGSDCDDSDSDVYPGAEEIDDDGVDNDCDGTVDSPAPDTGGPDTEDCGGTDPVMDEFALSQTTYDFNGPNSADPAIQMSMSFHDDDGDLHDLTIEIFVDTVVDGSLDTSGGYDFYAAGTGIGADCTVDSLTGINLVLSVGNQLDYSTEYEIGARVVDANGDISNLLIDSITTQDPEGGGDTGCDSGDTGCEDEEPCDSGDTGCEDEEPCDSGDTGCEGEDTAGDTGDDTGGDTGLPTYSYATDIPPIWDKNCAGCHTGGGALGGLVLDAPSYKTVVGVASEDVPIMNLIEPGAPLDSYIWHKLNGTQVSVGGGGYNMPLGGKLSAGDLSIIEAWITAGAAP